jgi:hypothetical protein
MENNSSGEIILKGQGKIFLLQYLVVIICVVPVLAINLFYIEKFGLVENFPHLLNSLLPAVGLVFILLFVIMLTLSGKKREIIITKDYVSFPESRLHKYIFKKGEIERIAILIPWLSGIGKYFGEGNMDLHVFYRDNGVVKSAGQAVYADFDPEKVVSSLQEFGYKVDRDAKGAIWGQ